MKPDIDYTLYLCTDRNIMTTETIEESVELAINGRRECCPAEGKGVFFERIL